MAKGFLDGYPTYDPSDGYGNPDQWQKAFRQRMNKDDAENILQQQSMTPHQFLGIQPGATPDEIKKAFRRLITQWHPDKNQHRLQESEEMSKKIIAAYTMLSQ